jgi:pyridoxamine 5'-phosphate oxidase
MSARAPLDPDRLDPDPIAQLRGWHSEASAAGLDEPDAAALATADAQARPSARMVLVRGIDRRGLVFYTNYGSRKGRELETNPRGALLFHWATLGRQVRIEGSVERTGAGESDAYFASRPLGARVSAIVSPQSEPIESREALEARHRDLLARHRTEPPPRPDHWGGFRLSPERFEFWQNGPDRLHDRIEYVRVQGGWRRRRLAP